MQQCQPASAAEEQKASALSSSLNPIERFNPVKAFYLALREQKTSKEKTPAKPEKTVTNLRKEIEAELTQTVSPASRAKKELQRHKTLIDRLQKQMEQEARSARD